MHLKEIVLCSLLMIYIGGLAFFWGATTNDTYMILVFGFLVTHFIGNTFARNVILQRFYDNQIKNRYLRIFVDFAVNILIANIAIMLIRFNYKGRLDEWLIGPIIYGIIFGLLYLIYFVFTLKKSEAL